MLLEGITMLDVGLWGAGTCAVLRIRMQIVAKTETGAIYSMMSKCNGENQLLSIKGKDRDIPEGIEGECSGVPYCQLPCLSLAPIV